jgi:hypothetical protein
VEIRDWALKGAEQRLLEIAAEARAIFVAFPELRNQGRGFEADGVGGARRRGRPPIEASTPAGEAPRRRRRPKISPEGRKRISEAQKARWAKQKAQGSATESVARTSKPKPTARPRKKK